jgi:hypothetical protein
MTAAASSNEASVKLLRMSSGMLETLVFRDNALSGPEITSWLFYAGREHGT